MNRIVPRASGINEAGSEPVAPVAGRHRLGRSALFALAALAAAAGPARAADAPPSSSSSRPTTAAAPTTAPALAADEAAVDAIVADLWSDDPAAREAASKRLRDAGPDIIPALDRYRDHPSPEVANRVAEVMRSFKWMRDGAIVIWVDRGGAGERVGLRLGDVIVKVNDLDVVGHADAVRALGADVAVMHVWRDGKVRRVEAPVGKMGIRMSNWAVAKGGNDHARGLAALAAVPPNYVEAYRRLRAAREQGMEDLHTIGILTGLAARSLDDRYADVAYLAHRGEGEDCRLTHGDKAGAWDVTFHNTPFNSPHTKWLLGRYPAEPFSVDLYHELEDWFSRHGRNGPMAAELVAKPWPRADGKPVELAYHDSARMLVYLDARRYDDALAVWEKRADPTSVALNRNVLGLQAAVRGGNAEAAARIGLRLIDPATRDRTYAPEPAWCGFALAAAAGDDAAADGFLAGLDRLGPPALNDALTLRSVDALHNPAAADRVRAWLAGRPRPARPGRLEYVALARLVSDPTATAADFDAATKGWDPAAVDPSLGATLVTGQLRFGRLDDAEKTAAALVPPAGDPAAVTRYQQAIRFVQRGSKEVTAFARAHAAELAGPWKDAAGLVQVQPQRGTNATWLLRYDGQVFRVADGKLQRFDGLPIPPAPVGVAYRHLQVDPDAGVVLVAFPYGRTYLPTPHDTAPDVARLFDPDGNRWVTAAEYKRPLRSQMLPDDLLAERVTAPAAGGAPPPGAAPREYASRRNGFFAFEGDGLAFVRGTTGKAVDLSADAARALGRAAPLRMYVESPMPDDRIVVGSEAGVWVFDRDAGTLARVTLGLPDENVIAFPMPGELYGFRPDGKVLVGVAPQHGGRMFLVDPDTGRATPSTGYCGLGPPDWYADRAFRWRHQDPVQAIHATYLARLAAKK